MKRRKGARDMAAVLDKVRELSREEPSTDWSEAEWKSLMAAAVAQKIAGKEEREEPHRKSAHRMPALAYGGAALIMVAVIGYTLRNRVLKPAAVPDPYAQAVERTDVSPASPALETAPPGYVGGIAKPSKGDAAKMRSGTATLDARAESLPAPETEPVDAVPANPAPSVILASAAPVRSSTQDTITVKFVSPESGLRIVWVLNRNFEWKGESQ